MSYPNRPRATPDRIREVRRALRMTQRDFGKLVHRARDTVKCWELGRYKPSSDMSRLIEFLGEFAALDREAAIRVANALAPPPKRVNARPKSDAAEAVARFNRFMAG